MLSTGSPHRVRPEVTRYVSTFVLCGVMALFAGLLSVDAQAAQGRAVCGSVNQTSIDWDWPAPLATHRMLSASDAHSLDKDVDDPEAGGHGVTLAMLGPGALATRRQVLHSRIALPAAHADGQWMRAP
jgi:hypothetical protein